MRSKLLINALTVCAALVMCGTILADTQRSRELSSGLQTDYQSVRTPKGYDVQGVFTKPTNASGSLPTLFFVGWLSCDSIIYPEGKETDGFSKVVLRLIRKSGFAAFRIDKPGVGESKGPRCETLDFLEELDAYRAAFKHLLELPSVDSSRIVIVGLSNGGGIAPLIDNGTKAAGYVSMGGWGRTWMEHMIEHERERLTLSGKSPDEINRSMKLFPSFYQQYLVEKKTPGAVIQRDPRLKSIWYDSPNGQYGRPASFYQQLQDLNLEKAWSEVRTPVLVVRGSFDWIMSQHDTDGIVNAVNRGSSRGATLLLRARMDHFFVLHNSYAETMKDNSSTFDEGVVPQLMDWLRRFQH